MQRLYDIPFWKNAPFIRLLLPLITGIIIQWYCKLPLAFIIVTFISFGFSFFLFFLLPRIFKFRLRSLQGVALQLMLVSLGLFITWQKNIRNNKEWYGNFYHNDEYLLVRIDEPLTEKPKSFKADGYVEAVAKDGKTISCKGKLLLYFSKDSTAPALNYGDKIIFNKKLQAIKNSGNPGSFNYERYAAFQGIMHNVFLKNGDWQKVTANYPSSKNSFMQFIFLARQYVLDVLEKNISSGKDQLDIAKALLIGYTNDLDKDLVQAYSNTGVVHIIAISGMHLGLIYIMLVWLFAKIPFINKNKLLQAIIILSCLWLFSILTGASASVLRAAVMFSFISAGKLFFKNASIYNSLAVSAFVLLCYNPYYLWDVGFQLSYLAVLGIVVFQKPIYHLFYLKNNLLDKAWLLVSVSAAAQLLTTPICIYYFHQFPNLFMITNIIAVPLSSIILYMGVALLAFSGISFISFYLGKLVGALTWLMNKSILWINNLSFSVWDKIPATVLSTCILYVIIIGFSAWLIKKDKRYFSLALCSLFVFMVMLLFNNWQVSKQQKIIVYNVAGHQAIDFVSGHQYMFIGDSALMQEGMLQNFHLKPSRIFFQAKKQSAVLEGFKANENYFNFKNKKIVVVAYPLVADTSGVKFDADLVIVSKNPQLSMESVTWHFNAKLIVFDASNPVWKIEQWQQQCSILKQPCYSIPENGAFVCDVEM
ncbi:MAG: ComEC family competence protein [Ferruginibacter sp.]|nr:ComEC family competence protein [Bacteroidota bacterium]MBX2917876.1 ComEC family competence protein [Ferruginibacter sp.]